MPGGIRGLSLCILHRQTRCADCRNQDSDRSPARYRAARSRIAVKNVHRRFGERFQNSLLYNGSNPKTVDSRLRQRRCGRKAVSAVEWAVRSRLSPRDVEFLALLRTVRSGQITRRRIDQDGYDRIGLWKIHGRFLGQGRAHEPFPDGCADRPAGETSPHGLGFVVTGPDAGDQLGCVADEPGVLVNYFVKEILETGIRIV
jgi:hypothetical protein